MWTQNESTFFFNGEIRSVKQLIAMEANLPLMETETFFVEAISGFLYIYFRGRDHSSWDIRFRPDGICTITRSYLTQEGEVTESWRDRKYQP